MKFFRPRLLLLCAFLALMLQTFSLPGLAAGFVACFGSDGHVALEQAEAVTNPVNSGVESGRHHLEPCTDVTVSRVVTPIKLDRAPILEVMTAIVVVWVGLPTGPAPQLASVHFDERFTSASVEFTETIRLTI